jgi:hypothetical protein
MSRLTHAVYDAITGETKSEHPDASSAFAAAARIGGVKYGYIVGPIGMPPDRKDTVNDDEFGEIGGCMLRNMVGEKKPEIGQDPDGPGLFD